MLNSVKIAIILLAGVALASCSKIESSPLPEKNSSAPPVSIELSTPDKALKSYWAVLDFVRAKHYEQAIQAESKFAEIEAQQISAVTEAAIAKEFISGRTSRPETFSRDIIEVKIESESRAVIIVVIKNSTPIPEGAEVTQLEEERRANGERYRYILEKSQAGWRVAEIWSQGTYSLDWSKLHPRDNNNNKSQPSIPSLTYNGI